MTHIVSTSDESAYPKVWERVEQYPAFEARQVSEDTYQIRSAASQITVNKEGYDLFISTDKTLAWGTWLRNNKIKFIPREHDE